MISIHGNLYKLCRPLLLAHLYAYNKFRKLKGQQSINIYSNASDNWADWCKNTAVCDESIILGMIMCHTITNNFLHRAIKYQPYQSCQMRKIFKLNFRQKSVTPLERGHETERDDFTGFLERISQEIQSNQS